MGKLHQLQVFDSRLVVEYAHSDQEKLRLEAEKDRWAWNFAFLTINFESMVARAAFNIVEQCAVISKLSAAASKHGL